MTNDKEPIAHAYDITDGELVADIYTREAWDRLERAWWILVFESYDQNTKA